MNESSSNPRRTAIDKFSTDADRHWSFEESLPEIDQYDLAQPDRPEKIREAADKGFLGIIAGGGLYGFSSVWVGSLMSSWAWRTESLEQFLGLLVGALIASTIALLAGMIIAFFSTSLAYVLVLVFNWSMGHPLNRRSVVVMIGAFAGYIPTCWLVVTYLESRSANRPFSVTEFVVCLAPVLFAMMFGQIGGLLTASHSGTWKHLKHELEYHKEQPKTYQFGIMHLLKSMIWISALFAFDQIFSSHYVLIIFGMMILLATITWSADYLYFRWRKRKLTTDVVANG